MLGFLIKFSVLNVFRNRTQTMISLLAICSSITILLFFRGFIDFSLEGLKSSTIRTELGHVQIAKPNHFKVGGDIVNRPDNQLSEVESNAMISLFTKNNKVKSVSPRLQGSGVISFNDNTLYVKLTGVDPKRDEEFSSAETLIDGRQVRNENECVVGNSLYQALQVSLMQEVIILSTTEDGGMNAVTCQLVGVVETKSRDLDKVYTKLHLNNLQTLYDTKKINYFMILIDKTADLETFTQLLDTQLPKGTTYRKWTELAEYYQSVKSLYESIFNISIFSLIVIMTLSILNTISMSIFDRTSEIGMLRAIGMNKRQVFTQFLLEGGFLGLIGGLIGTGIAVTFITYLNQTGGIAMPPPPGMTSGYNAIINLSVSNIVMALSLALAASLLATIYPSYIATRKDIISSINEV